MITRLRNRILCFFEFHSWFSPLPWHGSLAEGWKRCRYCGEETLNAISITEYREMVKKVLEKKEKN